MTFDNEHLDVLQNLEFSIVQVYRHQATLVDRETLGAVEALIQFYMAEAHHRPPPLIRLPERAHRVFESVKMMCEWRLGREPLVDEQGRAPDWDLNPVPLDELILCLKRIRKSIRHWHKEKGRQGYLQFISQFLP